MKKKNGRLYGVIAVSLILIRQISEQLINFLNLWACFL